MKTNAMVCFFSAIGAAILTLSLPVFSEVEKNSQPEPSDLVRTKRFELVDDHGKTRIEMKMEKDQPVIALKDPEGRDRILIFHQTDATGIYIKDKEKDTRVGLAQFPHGGGIAMHGEKGKGAAVYVLMNKKARLDIYTPDGKLDHRWPPSPKAETPKEKKEVDKR